MRELPKVKRFRQILPSLVTVPKGQSLKLELYREKLPQRWVSAEDVDSNTGKWCCAVITFSKRGSNYAWFQRQRKRRTATKSQRNVFYLHMGITQRLASPSVSYSQKHKYIYNNPKEEWPPNFTYLILNSGKEKVALADPRKFGSCKFSDSLKTCIPSQCRSMRAVIMNQRL